MKTILMPTDGSTAADKALDLALDLAKLHGASLKILHVLLRDKEPWELLRLPEMSSADPELVEALKEMEQAPAVPHMADEIMANPNAADRPVPDAMLHAIGGHVMARAVARSGARHSGRRHGDRRYRHGGGNCRCGEGSGRGYHRHGHPRAAPDRRHHIRECVPGGLPSGALHLRRGALERVAIFLIQPSLELFVCA